MHVLLDNNSVSIDIVLENESYVVKILKVPVM